MRVHYYIYSDGKGTKKRGNEQNDDQFHKEAMERTMRKIEESKKSPMNSKDFADYMRRNFEQAKKIEAASK